ncbi:MAG: MBL fold metallo-hydrolase [Deltaproteobacteria bacterium]|jgi:glyoxylase-like metal-dependent hydrolase (beta-lactamase superfamily II)|nr:MBL fold metallo-hydrolase [Deltaproteobacteria bacterium]
MKLSEKLHFFPWNNPSANNCNTYFIDGEKKILVDPGHYHLFGHVRDQLAQLSLTAEDMDMVIITHGHPDHMEGVRLFENTETLIALHDTEMAFIQSVAPHYGEALGIRDFEPDILLKEGDLEIGDTSFQVYHTPGHSPGSVCLYLRDQKVLFTGDVVFNQGIGRTDLPGGNGEELKESIKRISGLDVSLLLTGHGDVVSGRDAVAENFKMIEDYWFAYL